MGWIGTMALGVLLVVVPAIAAGPAGAAERFFDGIADLPVMEGLEQLAGAGVSFDKPEGRIVEVAASGRVTRTAVLDFYAAVLPQLGWTSAGTGRYRRDGERLDLAISRSGETLLIRFSLAPE